MNVHSFVEVAVALPVAGTFSYAVPPALADGARVGARVLVPFGGRGVTGVIVRKATAPPAEITEVRELREVLDERPALEPGLVDLCLWIAEYYEAPPGEVLRAALPAGTQVASSKRILLTERGRAALAGEAGGALPPKMMRALASLAGATGAKAGRGTVWRGSKAELSGLVAAGLVEGAEARRGARVKARTVGTVRLARTPTDEERAALQRARRRADVVAALEASGGELDAPELARRVQGAAAAVRALVDAGLCLRGAREVMRDPWELSETAGVDGSAGVGGPAAGSAGDAGRVAIEPTAGQARALEALAAADGFRAFLLHGVTGSGKTEVYLRTIARALAAGKGALVLVPEIALTPQLAARFRARFGDAVAVLHSGLSDGERFDQWRRLRDGGARIALGARSAVFAPVGALGVIVVDEEHDSSFKQEEGVRYHARDVALVRAQRAGAICVLGSATPSLESYANAVAGRFTLLELPERPTARPLPAVEVVDLRVYRPDGEAMLTAPLAAAVEQTLAAGEQTILFLNRRGFATFVLCSACGHAFRCPHCSVSLTYHRAGDRLRCHYCAHAEATPEDCPSCRARAIRRLGLGTERIETALQARFPKARVARLDRDTSSGTGLRDVLRRVAAREVDVLVGTQMVTKGHDFPGVTLVGVLCADTGLSLPDFRAGERTFQLLTQVAGRAGRGDRPGRVIIQTYLPDHPAVVCASAHDYGRFFAAEMEVRAELGWPPHGRLVALRIDGDDERAVRRVAEEMGERARVLCAGQAGGGAVEVRGPAEAPLKKLKGKARWQLWFAAPDRAPLRSLIRRLEPPDATWAAGVRVSVDVDPMSAL